jgi:hypothetical protein
MPTEVQVIGGLQVASALFDLLVAGLWVVNAFALGLVTCGFGLVLCLPAVLLLPLAIAELAIGARVLGGGGSLESVRTLAVFQLAAIVTFSLMPVTAGAVILVMLRNPSVIAWFEHRG